MASQTITDSVHELINELNNGNNRIRPAVVIQPVPRARPRRKTNKTTVRVSKRKPGVRVTKRVVKG